MHDISLIDGYVTPHARLQQRMRLAAGEEPHEFLVVDIATQHLYLSRRRKVVGTYLVSTSRHGIGSTANSYKTPRGIHRIAERIGADAPAKRIFRDRRDTGCTWDGVDNSENLILTRILRLEGLEEGLNRGPGIDSYDRFIYIHGTNREDLLGTPHSHGCVTMGNNDIIELFDMVEEGTIVVID